jgi:Family of unknown function (DUF6069)
VGIRCYLNELDGMCVLSGPFTTVVVHVASVHEKGDMITELCAIVLHKREGITHQAQDQETQMITQLTYGTPVIATESIRRAHSYRSRRAAAVVGTIAAATVTWLALTNVAGVVLRVPTYARTPSTSALGLAQVIVTTLIAALLAWGVLATIERFSGKARRLWTIVAPAAAVASLLVPLTAPALAGSQRLSLVVFHVVVASVLILTLRATLAVTNSSASEKP